MIVLAKAGQSTVIVTLKDNVTIANPYYLFVFSSKVVGDKKYLFFSSDVSAYPERYNEFVIEEGVDFEAPVGDYQYKIYQKVSATLTVPSEDNLLEEGIMRLDGVLSDGSTTITTTKEYDVA
jgi:hypothetical protein